MNIKKLFSVAAVVTFVGSTFLNGLALAATPDTELGKAYEWAHSKGITTMDTYEAANMDQPITRAQMAKMLSVYAMTELGMKPDTSKTECNEFNDIANITGDLHEYIITSCQLGLMGQGIFSGIKEFRPNANISRAEFGTALSRTLWGGKYEGGTPYYANHLAALQSAGIMKIIANAETTQEIRGYVMLMLMRSAEGSETKADCEDPMIKAACLIDDDSCPAECKASDEKEDTVVKSGDLAVKATAADGKKAILDNGVSDLDTITLKASEKITVNSITLERFGYSTANDVESIWLEDGDGNKIADEKSLSSTKDTVTLKIKKEYREMDASNALTIVLKTAKFHVDAEGKACYDAACDKKAGSTIGFKVTDVDASAKNLDISDYTPYTYDLASYDGATVTVTAKGNNKTYNYEEGEYYEVSRLRVKAGASILSLNGITLTNKWAYTSNNACAARDWYTCEDKAYTPIKWTLDLDEFVSKVKVTADGKEVDGLKFNVTKDNELVLNWDTIEVAINKDVQIVVSIAMENLDEFGKVVRLTLKEGDLNAVEKKTGARVNVNAIGEDTYKAYIFNGSKIKFSNTKLSSSIDAAKGSQDVIIAQGKVTVAEEVKISELPFTVTPANIIEDMTLTIAGESYDATKNGNTFTFKNVFIEKSGDFELSVDVDDADAIEAWTVVSFEPNSISKAIFAGNNGRYETSREYVGQADVSGSISISKVKVQESKASLKNNKSTTVEFVKDEQSDRVTLFEGTYTAKKADITLKEFAIVGTAIEQNKVKDNNTTAEFYVYVNGEEVGNIDETEMVVPAATTNDFDSYEDFSDEVIVKAGESVKVEIKAVIEPKDSDNTNINLDLYLRWEDKDGAKAWFAKAGLTTFKYVLNGSLTISDSTTIAKSTVVLQANDVTVAKFTIKPSKSDSVKLDNLIFDFSEIIPEGTLDEQKAYIDNHITVEVDGVTVDDIADNDDDYTFAANKVKYDATSLDDVDEEVEVEVKVSGLAAAAGAAVGALDTAKDVKLVSINGVTKNSTYTRLILPAIVKFDTQKSDGSFTTYRVEVEDYDGAQIYDLVITYAGDKTAKIDWLVTNGATFDAANQTTASTVSQISFVINKGTDTAQTVTLSSTDYPDFFKVTDGTTLRVYKAD